MRSITYASEPKLLRGKRASSFFFLLSSISASHFSSFTFKSVASYYQSRNENSYRLPEYIINKEKKFPYKK